MQMIMLMGSRNPVGQTARAADAFLQGAASRGSQVEQLFLPQMKIERCRQCRNDGWGKCRTEGRCVIKDDFATVAAKIRHANAVVFATPVYFYDLSESLRSFLDRLRRTCVHKSGRGGIVGKRAIGICVAGGGGSGALACAVNLEKILTRCGFDVLDMIPVRRQNLEMKLRVLRMTGEWLATLVNSYLSRRGSVQRNGRQIGALDWMEANNEPMTGRRYREISECSAETARRDLSDLADRGLLIRAGKGRSTFYRFPESRRNDVVQK